MRHALTFGVETDLVEGDPRGLITDEFVHFFCSEFGDGQGITDGLGCRLHREGSPAVSKRGPGEIKKRFCIPPETHMLVLRAHPLISLHIQAMHRYVMKLNDRFYHNAHVTLMLLLMN